MNQRIVEAMALAIREQRLYPNLPSTAQARWLLTTVIATLRTDPAAVEAMRKHGAANRKGHLEALCRYLEA